MKNSPTLRLVSGVDSAEAAIRNASDYTGLALAREEIMSADPFKREALWSMYHEQKELIAENGTSVREMDEIKELSWDNFLFGGNDLTRHEEFMLSVDGKDYCDIMVEEMALNDKSFKTQLFHHTLKQLRKSAVKRKNYAKFSMIIKWVFEHKTRYNTWELKHIFRSHKELKKMFFPNVPMTAKKAA